MTDKSDTQTNPKTQPLYFMTWDEVEEGQKVLLVGATHTKLTSGIVYTRKGDHLTFTTGTHRQQQAGYTYINYKYIPVPQDRPKPNIWDEYMDKVLTGFRFNFWPTECPTMKITIYERWVVRFPKTFRALVAWINHVLDGE